MDLIVIVRELHYEGKPRLKGEIFSATERDAKLLKLLGKAADAPVSPPSPVGHVATTSAPAEVEAPAVVEPLADEPDAVAPTRRYRTRRLKTED